MPLVKKGLEITLLVIKILFEIGEADPVLNFWLGRAGWKVIVAMFFILLVYKVVIFAELVVSTFVTDDSKLRIFREFLEYLLITGIAVISTLTIVRLIDIFIRII